jgi:nickel-dependent lactate racemase
VITTSAGYPLDATFYQAIKGLVGALPAVKAGGTIIMAASLSEGLGGEEFSRTLLEIENMRSFMDDIISGRRFVIDQWQIEELARTLRKARVMLYSDGLDEDVAKNIFVESVSSVEEGIEKALERHGRNARIAVIPKGPYSIPYQK